MKKRILATLLVGAVAASGIIGLSACGVGSVALPKGENVTKEVWETAFTEEQLEKLTNYTASASDSTSITVSGTYKNSDGSDEEISLKLKTSSYRTILYNAETESYYSEYMSSTSSTTTIDGETENGTGKYTSKSYVEKGEKESEYWSAAYSKQELKTDDSMQANETYWNANRVTYAPSNMYPGIINSINRTKFSSTKDGTAESTISELYDSFKYDGGVYTATLYSEYYVNEVDDVEIGFVVEYKISVSFKDGYLIGLSAKVNESATQDGATYTIKSEQTYAITSIGNTDPSKKGTGDIKKAVDKAKKGYSEAESNR